MQYVVAKARTAHAPGMNGFSYKLHKRCERVVAILTSLLNKLWKVGYMCLRSGVRQTGYIHTQGRAIFYARPVSAYLSIEH